MKNSNVGLIVGAIIIGVSLIICAVILSGSISNLSDMLFDGLRGISNSFPNAQ